MIEKLLRAVKEMRTMRPSTKRRGRYDAMGLVARLSLSIPLHADVDVVIAALVEATAELIYLSSVRRKDGADWWHADHKGCVARQGAQRSQG